VIKDIDLFGPSTAGGLVLAEGFVKRNPGARQNLVEDFAKAFERTRTHSRSRSRSRSREENECDPFGGIR
jgi:hypothetical protein